MIANTIAFISQKGGTGKTMSAAAVIVEAARDRVRVIGADLDGKQRSLTDWSSQRLKHGHLPQVEVRAVNYKQARLVANECELLVVDTAGWVDTETVELAQFADLVVIPSGTNRVELAPAAVLVQALWRHEIHPGKIVVALTRVRSDPQEREAKQFLAEIDVEPLYPSLADRDVWTTVGNDGRSFCETGQKAVDDEARAYVRGIGRALERARRLQVEQNLAQSNEISRGRGRRR